MRNIFLLETKKPSRLHKYDTDYDRSKLRISPTNLSWQNAFHIYIVSEEEIKVGDYFIESLGLPDSYLVHKLSKEWKDKESFYRRCAKVILTTDADLIEDRVERIDNEFLKWFVNNPTCEFIEVSSLRIKNQKTGESGHYSYVFNIPQEEETKEKEHPFFNLKLNKEEAEHLLRCLVQTNAKGKDLDIGEEVEGKICDYLKNNK